MSRNIYTSNDIQYSVGNILEKHYITGADIIQMDYIWREKPNV